MSQADKNSRLTVTTRTVGDEYYDQVLAMSSHVINDGWEQLWNTYQDPDTKAYSLKRIDIDDPDLGSIHASILPCKIQFDGDNRAGIKVYYYIRFESGTLANDKHMSVAVDGWCLCVSVRVGEQKHSDMTAEQIKFIDDNYNVPGDYTIARLFADLSDAYFDDLDPARSTFGTDKDGNTITWKDWKTAHKNLVGQFYAFMSEWVSDMQDKGLSTLGVKVIIPSMQDDNPLDPTYPPTAMLHQAFKYNNPQTDPKIAADYDCLMYCEVRNRKVPTSTFIPDGGNWCYPENGSNPAVYGTFAISSQIFFQRDNGTLQHMRPFAALSEITLHEPTIDETGDRYHLFDIGHNPGQENPDDDYFLAQADLKNYQFIWTKTHYKEKGSTNKWGTYNYCYHQSVQTVTIGWAPGSSSIALSGKTTYNYEDTDWEDSSKTKRKAILAESYTATWAVSIGMTTDDQGHLTLKLGTKPEDAKVTVVQDYHTVEGYWINLQNTIEGYMSDIQKALRNALVPVEHNLAKIFETTGQWVYPGNGVVQYSNPMFNNYGDVLAEATYKSLNSKVEVPNAHPGASLAKYPKTVANAKVFTASREDDD